MVEKIVIMRLTLKLLNKGKYMIKCAILNMGGLITKSFPQEKRIIWGNGGIIENAKNSGAISKT